ncbi:MAG: CDP-glycerol glycerophosphotransferase family protein [Eubacterium sp.]|nr:CDP-glycerol glycerophosphotransferase family protein [Eubacterium sp.]
MIWFGKENINEIDACPDFSHLIKQDSKLKAFGLDVAKKSTAFRALSRDALNYRRRAAYNKRTKGVKTNPKVILFSTFDGRYYSDSPKAIYEYMLSDSRFDDFTFVWACRRPQDFKFLLDNKNTYLVQVGTREYDLTCATAKYWLFNSRIGDYIYPKDDQVYVQLWHGTPLKRLGYDIVKSDNVMNSRKEIQHKYKIDAKKFKYILVPSDFAKHKFISAWNLKEFGKENAVIAEGYPRNDFLFHFTEEDSKRIKEELSLPEGKKIILYAPTWRDNQHTSDLGYTYEIEADFDKLKEALSDEYIILFRAHYLFANSFNFEKYKGFVWDVSGVEDINWLYVISDMLITDYSSVFFDYANLKRPIFFYMYDYNSYANKIRGFYVNTDELPGPIVLTTDKLVKAIKGFDFDNFCFDKKYPEFANRFNYLDDGYAAKRVAEKVIEEI